MPTRLSERAETAIPGSVDRRCSQLLERQGYPSMRVVELGQAEPYAAGNLRVGEYAEMILATGADDSPDNFRLSYATATAASWTHRHPKTGRASVRERGGQY